MLCFHLIFTLNSIAPPRVRASAMALCIPVLPKSAMHPQKASRGDSGLSHFHFDKPWVDLFPGSISWYIFMPSSSEAWCAFFNCSVATFSVLRLNIHLPASSFLSLNSCIHRLRRWLWVAPGKISFRRYSLHLCFHRLLCRKFRISLSDNFSPVFENEPSFKACSKADSSCAK